MRRRSRLRRIAMWTGVALPVAVVAAWLFSQRADVLGPTQSGTAQPGGAMERSSQAERAASQEHAPPKHPAPSFANVKYGPHERNVLDLYLAPSKRPVPLVMYIHDGGFTQGDKTWLGPEFIEKCLQKHVSVASINYRFLVHAPLQDILRDAARSVQFLRFHAAKYNIDKKNLACFGKSAGGGASLWLGTHDDLADAAAEDPVLRESSRPTVIGAVNAQCSYDFARWPAVVGESPLVDDDAAAYFAIYWLKSREELQSPLGRRIRADLDMFGLLDSDDCPMFLFCDQRDGEATSYDHYMHHPRHSIAVKSRCDEVGVECELLHSDQEPVDPQKAYDRLLEFLLRHLDAGSHAATPVGGADEP